MTANLNNLLGELVLMCTDTDVFSVRILILLYCGIIVGVVIKPLSRINFMNYLYRDM